jgi:hypothetical protein
MSPFLSAQKDLPTPVFFRSAQRPDIARVTPTFFAMPRHPSAPTTYGFSPRATSHRNTGLIPRKGFDAQWNQFLHHKSALAAKVGDIGISMKYQLRSVIAQGKIQMPMNTGSSRHFQLMLPVVIGPLFFGLCQRPIRRLFPGRGVDRNNVARRSKAPKSSARKRARLSKTSK